VIYLHWIANKHYLVLARGLDVDEDNQFLIGAGHGTFCQCLPISVKESSLVCLVVRTGPFGIWSYESRILRG
jgi:hypothetical protein